MAYGKHKLRFRRQVAFNLIVYQTLTYHILCGISAQIIFYFSYLEFQKLLDCENVIF